MRKLARAQALKQASSSRVGGPESRQAPSANELDRDPGLGYYGINKTKPPLKVSSIRAVSKAGSFRAVSRQSRDVSLHKSSPGAVYLPSTEFYFFVGGWARSSQANATDTRIALI